MRVSGSPTVTLLPGSRARAADALVVPRGESAAFLAPWSVGVLAPHVDGGTELADLLARLGLRTLGAFAELPEPSVLGRFGLPGVHAHRLARGESMHDAVPAALPPELVERVEFDPPAERVDEAVFAAKSLADQLLGRLDELGLSCTRVVVEAETEHGERLARCWRHDGSLTAATLVTRVRWQLEGWLTATGGITKLCLVPDEVVPATGRQLGFWGGDPAAADHAGACARAGARDARTRVGGHRGPGRGTDAHGTGALGALGRGARRRSAHLCAVAGRGARSGAGAGLRPAGAGRARRRRRSGRHRQRARRTVGSTSYSALRRVAARWRTARFVGGTVAVRPPLVGPNTGSQEAPSRVVAGGRRRRRRHGDRVPGRGHPRSCRGRSRLRLTPGARLGACGSSSSVRDVPVPRGSRQRSGAPQVPGSSSSPTTRASTRSRYAAAVGTGVSPIVAADDPGPPGLRRLWDVAFGAPDSLRARTAARRSLAALEEQPRGTGAPDAHRGPEGEHAAPPRRGARGAAQPAARHSPPHREVDPIALHGRVDRRELGPRRGRVPSASARRRREPDGDAVPGRPGLVSQTTRDQARLRYGVEIPATDGHATAYVWGVAVQMSALDDALRRIRTSMRSITRISASIRSGGSATSRPPSASTGPPTNEAAVEASNRPGTGYELNRIAADLTRCLAAPPVGRRRSCRGRRDRAVPDCGALRPRGVQELVTAFVFNVTFDCADPRTLSAFWSAVTGYEPTEVRDDFVRLRAPDHRGVRHLLFFKVPEPKTVKNRMHVDLATRDVEVEIARARWARRDRGRPTRGQRTTSWVVMNDPEGNEFCIG